MGSKYEQIFRNQKVVGLGEHANAGKKRQHLRAAIDIHSSGFKRYFANTSWLMGHRILSMIVALFVGVYVARYLVNFF